MLVTRNGEAGRLARQDAVLPTGKSNECFVIVALKI